MPVADSISSARAHAYAVVGRTLIPAVGCAGRGQTDMTVGWQQPHTPSAASAVTPSAPGRLGLKPRGALDGAWWPRSNDPLVELTALIEALEAQRAPARRITLARTGWDSAPRRIRLQGHRGVALDWVHNQDVHLVRIIDTDDQRIDLLLIPIDTSQALAQLALGMATAGHDPQIPTTGGQHPTPGCPAANAEAVVANDGGLPAHDAQDQAGDTPHRDVILGRQRVILLPHHPAEHTDLPHT